MNAALCEIAAIYQTGSGQGSGLRVRSAACLSFMRAGG